MRQRNPPNASHADEKPLPITVENIYRAPGPGEFMSTPEYIFFQPNNTGEKLWSPRNAFVPTQEEIIQARGIENHHFQDLQFSHTTWRIANSKGGYVPTQSMVTPNGHEPRGAVDLRKAKHVSVDRCVFSNIGAAFAISVGDASDSISIMGSKCLPTADMFVLYTQTSHFYCQKK